MILLLLLHFTNDGEISDISRKSAISAKNAKFAFWDAVTHLFRNVTILEAKNVGLQQHFRPWARNEPFSLNFTKFR